MFFPRPFECEERIAFRLLRVRPGKQLRGVILDDRVDGVYVHWIGSRSIVCLDPKACGCDAKNAPRWRGYVWLSTVDLSSRVLLEVVPSAEECLRVYLATSKSLRGTIWTFERVSGRPNGAVHAACTGTVNDLRRLDRPPSVRLAIAQLYGIKPSALGPGAGNIARENQASEHAGESSALTNCRSHQIGGVSSTGKGTQNGQCR